MEKTCQEPEKPARCCRSYGVREQPVRVSALLHQPRLDGHQGLAHSRVLHSGIEFHW